MERLNRIVILDSKNQSVLIIDIKAETFKKLSEEYNMDIECWFYEEGYEKRFGVNLNECGWMWVDADWDDHEIINDII